MQIILSQDECEIIYEGLRSEVKYAERDLKNAQAKNQGSFEQKYLNRVVAIKERFEQYIEDKTE